MKQIQIYNDRQEAAELCNLAQLICLIPLCIFIIIESIQLKIAGLKYFEGWNISDFLFCVIALFYLNIENFNRQNSEEHYYLEYLPEMKLFIFGLSVAKLM